MCSFTEMLGFGEQKTGTSTQTTKIDPKVKSLGYAAIDQALAIGNQTFPGYDPAKRVQGLSKEELYGIDGIQDLARDKGGATYGQAGRLIHGYANAGPSTIGRSPTLSAGNIKTPAQLHEERIRAERVKADQVKAGKYRADQIGKPQTVNNQDIRTERVVDENGRLGKIKDYVNPHMDAVVNPALRDIRNAGKLQRQDIGTSATFGGAFGDARHGVAEGVQMGQEMQEIGDTSGALRYQGYQDAMGRRADDLNRFVGVDTTNAANDLTADTFNVDALFRRDAANQAANSRASEFNLSKALEAMLANQGANLRAGEGNADRALKAADTNAGRAFDADRFNITTGIDVQDRNIGRDVDADKFNINTGVDRAKFNAGARETALDRRLKGADSLVSMRDSILKDALTRLGATMKAGGLKTAHGQAGKDAEYEEYLRGLEWPFRQLDAMTGTASGTPTAQSVTTSGTKPGSGGQDLMAALAALLGSGG